MKRNLILVLILCSLIFVGCLSGGGGSGAYTVSGRIIVKSTSAGLEGVSLISASSNLAESAHDGSWKISGLTGTVTLTPYKEGWVFNPTSKQVSGATSNIVFKAIPNSGVTFVDPNLEQAVRASLEKPLGPLTMADCATIIGLDADQRDIESLMGIEALVDLKAVQLHGNKISDLTPLQGLTKLEFLNLNANEISDLGPLQSLTNLETLAMDGNRISNLNPLAGLTELKILTLGGNGIRNLGALQNLVSLEQLWLYENQLTGLTGLEALTRLKWLWLDCNDITDLSPLQQLTNLDTLYLNENRISDLSALAELRNLEDLGLAVNQIADIGVLQGLPKLESVGLGANQISDISALVANLSFASGAELDLRENLLDLSPGSANMRDIQTLQDRGVEVEYEPQRGAQTVSFGDPNLEQAVRAELNKPSGELTAAELGTITLLNATELGITDLSGIEHLVNLEVLGLAGNQLTDLGPLAGLRALKELYLSENQIEDLSPLAGLTNLVELSLYENRIEDIAALAGLSALEELHLDHNRIVDLEPLRGLTSLNFLWLNENQISDISALVGNQSLGAGVSINITHNQLDLATGSQGRDDLEELLARGAEVQYTPQMADQEVFFTDPNLEAAIRDDVQKPVGVPLTNADIQHLVAFSAHDSSISNLAGIEQLICLEYLVLNDNEISDLSPLAALTRLEELHLVENKITSLSGLEGLSRLEVLNLDRNDIEDLSPLVGLRNLKKLWLYGNQVSNLEPLRVLSSLEFAQLGYNLFTDVSPLAGLDNAVNLIIGWNSILTDITPLEGANWGQGVTLDIHNAWELDISPGTLNYATLVALRNKGVTIVE